MKIARPTTAAEIRQAFLDFFEEKGHTRVASAPLVPHGDDTLLFVNAGMVPFKDTFLGLEKRPYVRAASSQKCMRVSGKHNDLEEVGPSPRHHTFFEMLGNFSFGDYFKREAIHYAWEALTTVFGVPGDRLVATVFLDDDLAYGVWQNEIGLPAERILRMGEKTNFWSMGDTGPCGPTSELHFDWGPAACTCGRPDCSVALDNGCARWLEVWNLVFMQFDQDANGVRTPLPKPGVDTGMGLERLVSVIQGATANYDTDLFRPIMLRVQELLNHDDAQMAAQYVSYRVIADHARAITFLIGDGVLPGNEGRNYILRLVLRRAARHGRLLGFTEPFLHRVSRTVIDQMGGVYPELAERADFILSTIQHEEERFLRTLDLGLALLEELMAEVKAQGQGTLPGDAAFRLWDTYGFPLDLTRDIAVENGLTIDLPGYRAALEQQRQRARAAAQFGGAGDGKDLSVYAGVLERLPAGGVDHLYLVATESESAVVALIADGAVVSQASAGQQVEIVLAATPFYVESGGQVSDTGIIRSVAGSPSWEVAVSDTRRPVAGVIVHRGQVTHGAVTEGSQAVAAVDVQRRWDIMRNHTATHLLHAELRRVLGAHVHQAGSLVAPDRLRFDFTHPGMVSEQELAAIEQGVNDWIYRNDPVTWRWMAYKDAVATGAMALFGEKYGDEVRVVEVGGAALPTLPTSRELCGGNHVNNTAEIGVFHISSEGGVSSGVRRIEAVTGRGAHARLQERLGLLHRTASALGAPETEIERRAQALMEQVASQQKELARLREQAARQEFQTLLSKVVAVNGIQVLAQPVSAADANVMRQMTDWFRNQLGSGVVVLGAGIDGKPQLVAAVTDDLVARGVHAGKLVQTIAKRLGGGGGGRPNLAQAGGVDLAGLPAALAETPALVAEQAERSSTSARS
ncbi:MAG TPA: alanine--tRNA ligase [Anaerolineae bacterium]|nr:alanine--tRNA ligase [Anaerolineae bacterium]HNU04745.1 alanine--tRNA ligase [Anaerolineae bacterium]